MPLTSLTFIFSVLLFFFYFFIFSVPRDAVKQDSRFKLEIFSLDKRYEKIMLPIAYNLVT